MGQINPKVSVVIPTFNRCNFVLAAIDSVLGQTYTDHEIIVVDDGSTDGTSDALHTRYGDRISYIWQENEGESVARNRGIESAEGKYVALLDSDDRWQAHKLAKQVPVLEAEPWVAMVYCQAWWMDSQGRTLDLPPINEGIDFLDLNIERLCFENGVGAGGSTAVIRMSALEEVGGFDPAIRYGEDWDLWLRLRASWDFAFIPEPLAKIRRHADAQHQFPNPEQATHLLSDRMRMLRNAFSHSPESFPHELRERINAHHYALAAFAQYAAGHGDLGCQNLTRAAQLDPGNWGDKNRLADELVSIALMCIEGESFRSARRGIACLNEAITHWPSAIPITKKWIRSANGRVYAGAGFSTFKIGHRPLTRGYFLRALASDASWLRNAGVLSILGETILGLRIMHLVRRLVQFLRRTSLVPA